MVWVVMQAGWGVGAGFLIWVSMVVTLSLGSVIKSPPASMDPYGFI